MFYYHKSNPRIVNIGVPASDWDESEKIYRHYIRELTEEEKTTVAGLGLEYKVIPYNERYLKTMMTEESPSTVIFWKWKKTEESLR